MSYDKLTYGSLLRVVSMSVVRDLVLIQKHVRYLGAEIRKALSLPINISCLFLIFTYVPDFSIIG